MDLKVLRLFKQHFLDVYSQPLQCDYSCWGYYDGISISTILPDRKSKLQTNENGSSITDLWYGMTELAGKLQGLFSEQDIGIFRKNDEQGKIFGRLQHKYPYVVVGFLQLDKSNNKDIDKIVESIEKSKNKQDKKEFEIFALTYFTFDNADLVVLILGNSIIELEKKVRSIEELPEVTYSHVIMGVSEKYLEYCSEKGGAAELWNGTNCHLDDQLKNIRINLVAKIKRGFERIVSEEWTLERNNVISSYVTGHENLILEISDSSVRVLIQLLMKDGFSTHQNKLYKKGVYNITTGIRATETLLRPRSRCLVFLSRRKSPDCTLHNWCSDKMDIFKKRMTEAVQAGDESLYSYYNSLLLTLNTLSQFEKFSLSRNVFYMVFPAFKLFDALLSDALGKAEEEKKGELLEKIRNSICGFLDSINSIIYHTVHTDQMFLMIPGYTGTSCLIPIKLCLFYLWFINKVIDLLNDSQELFEYQCLLVPERESKTTTDLIDMGLPPGNRLICVKLSQRSLYMPGDLLLILTHEIAHYVGDSIRNRNERIKCIAITVSAIVAHSIIYGSKLSAEEKEITDELKFLERRLKDVILQKLRSGIKKRLKDAEYHDNVTRKHMVTELDLILADKEGALSRILNVLPENFFDLNDNGKSYNLNRIRVFYDLQNKFVANKNYILATGAARKLVYELSDLYKEIFSDVAAYMILGYDPFRFDKAYIISEGYTLDNRRTNPQALMRNAVIQYLCNPENCKEVFGRSTQQGVSSNNNSNDDSEQIDIYVRVAEDFYYFDVTKNYIINYVNICKKSINSFFESNGKERLQKDVKVLFEKFSRKQSQDNRECDFELYKIISKKIDEYVEQVQKVWL